jgi:hypothetical protein
MLRCTPIPPEPGLIARVLVAALVRGLAGIRSEASERRTLRTSGPVMVIGDVGMVLDCLRVRP